MVVNIEHMRRVGDGQLLVSFNDHEILVVVVRRLVSKVVASRDNYAIIGKGIDDEHLVMNDGETCVEDFFLPTFGNDFPIEGFGTNDPWILPDGSLYPFDLLRLAGPF